MARTGRPNKLDAVATRRRDGTPVTVAEQIIERVQLGMTHATAARSAGVSRDTMHRWRLDGARLRALQASGELRRPTANQQRLIDFSDNLDRAEAEAEAIRLGIVQGAAIGGGTITKTTRKVDTQGNILETTTVTETIRPDWRAAAWWLERRRDGYTPRVELTGADGAPLVPEGDAARDLADSLRAYLEGRADAQAEAEAQS